MLGNIYAGVYCIGLENTCASRDETYKVIFYNWTNSNMIWMNYVRLLQGIRQKFSASNFCEKTGEGLT